MQLTIEIPDSSLPTLKNLAASEDSETMRAYLERVITFFLTEKELEPIRSRLKPELVAMGIYSDEDFLKLSH